MQEGDRGGRSQAEAGIAGLKVYWSVDSCDWGEIRLNLRVCMRSARRNIRNSETI